MINVISFQLPTVKFLLNICKILAASVLWFLKMIVISGLHLNPLSEDHSMFGSYSSPVYDIVNLLGDINRQISKHN